MSRCQKWATYLMVAVFFFTAVVWPQPVSAQSEIDPAGWKDPTEVFGSPPEVSAAEVTVEQRAALFAANENSPVPNAAMDPNIGEANAAGTLEQQARECFWSNLLDEQAAPDYWDRRQGGAWAGQYYYARRTDLTGIFSVSQSWDVPAEATEKWLQISFRGAKGSGYDSEVPLNVSTSGTPGHGTSLALTWGQIENEWKTAVVKLDPAELFSDSTVWVSPGLWAEGARLELDQIGLVYCKEAVDIETWVPEIITVTSGLDPESVMVPVLGAGIWYHVSNSLPLYNEFEFTNLTNLISNGCGGWCFSARFLPGNNPLAKGELRELYGTTGPWVSPYLQYVRGFGKNFDITRQFDVVKATEYVAEATKKLNATGTPMNPEKRLLLEQMVAWTQDKINLWNSQIKGNPELVKAVNSRVIFGFEIPQDALSRAYKNGSEFFVKSGQLTAKQIRVVIFDEGESDEFIVNTLRQALRKGAPLSAVRVLRGDMEISVKLWSAWASDKFGPLQRYLPAVIAEGSGVFGSRFLTGAGIRGIAAETGGITFVSAAGASFVVGLADTGFKTYQYGAEQDWATSLTWSQYTCINHGFTRLFLEYSGKVWCEDETYVESRLSKDQFQPLVVKIPDHQITGRRYSDGKQIFLTHPEVSSYWMVKIKSLDEDSLTLEKQLSDGSTTEIVISYGFGQGTYTLVYDHKDLGLMTMTFEIMKVSWDESTKELRVGTSFFETTTPEAYGACPGWSPTRPESTPCYLGAYPARDYDLYLDVDEDGVQTNIEKPDPNHDGDPADCQNTDKDALCDYLDTDDDGDGFPTSLEGGGDADWDGIRDYLDGDSHPAGLSQIFLPLVSN